MFTEEKFKDFVARLKYHNVGEGVEDHYTAWPIFNVMKRVIFNGMDLDYTDKVMISMDDWIYYSWEDFYNSLGKEDKQSLDNFVDTTEVWRKPFLELTEYWKKEILGEWNNNWIVSGYVEVWEYVNSHLTRESAEDFLKNKNPDNYRIEIDSQYKCQEWKSLIEGLICGDIVFKTTIS